LQPAVTRSALSILTRSGYIEYSDESLTMSRIMILVDKSEFYSLALDDATESVFQGILRIYPGLFADYVQISESRIALSLGVTELAVTSALVTLSRMHVIHYIPRRLTPYVYYPTSRELPRYLVIPRTVYEEQRERFEKRLEAIRRFAFSDDCCRSQIMLEYFGETDAAACGICDVCRDRLRREPSEEQRLQLIENIMRLIAAAGEMKIESILSAYPTRRKIVTEILRQLADEGKLRIAGDCVLHIG
ncbi:MAG: RecQ family zinc-binding domain-containing protein, partial [Muribaculaceae bacterium]|nr:RecQ family zinc-binding domain-containing protein [Muribaculaceae bacterium]